MTTFERFESDLPQLLEELAPLRTPDYLDLVFGRTIRAHQRPARTFLGRWLSTSTLPERMASELRVPWRAIFVVALLLIALTAVAVYVGSRPLRLPKPFGPAANGQVAYVSEWDIYLADPSTGTSTAIVSDPLTKDTDPVFSPDGTRLAFIRNILTNEGDYEIVVTRADGSDLSIVATLPITFNGPPQVQWAPNSQTLLVAQGDGELSLYNSRAGAPARLVATTGSVDRDAFRPPDGDLLLFRRLDASGVGLYVASLTGFDVRPVYVVSLAESSGAEDLGYARWSPDGSRIAFNRTPVGLTDKQHLYVMNADGSDPRELPMGTDTAYANNPIWSPDGTRIAFRRWDTNGIIQPIGVLSLATGRVEEVGPYPGPDGVGFDWSPDGREILELGGGGGTQIQAIDIETGQIRTLASALDSVSTPSWQRVLR